MTDIYIICSDGVMRRMLSLELSARGAHVCETGKAPAPPCALIISAPDFSSDVLSGCDDCLTVIFGYPEELENLSVPPSCIVMNRPFAVNELMYALFGEEQSDFSPVLRRRSLASRISLDKKTRTVKFCGMSASLSKREFALLELLYAHRGKAVSRAEAYSAVWGGGENENVVDVYICYIREKTEKPFGIRLIKTMRGNGYLFEE